MARALFGGGLTGLSGSVNKQAGGFTFNKNNTVRVRVTPTNPMTVAQTLIRALFFFLTSSWKSLNTAKIDAWETARNSDSYYLKQDPVTGVSRKYASAKDLFIAMNQNRNIAKGTIDAPAVYYDTPGLPSAAPVEDVTDCVFDESANTVTLTATLDAGYDYFMRATPQVSAGYTRFTAVRSKMRIIKTALATGDISADYFAVFPGALVAGQKVFWEIIGVDQNTGKAHVLASRISSVVA